MFRDIFSLFVVFIHNNWKIILVSTIGLTLALATVSETNIVLQYYRSSLFEEFLSGSTYDYEHSDFDVKISTRIDNETQSGLRDMINKTQGLGQKTVEKLGFNTIIERETWHLLINVLLFFKESNSTSFSNDSIDIDALDNNTLYICESFLTSGRLPIKSNEVVLIAEENLWNNYNLQLGNETLLSSRELDQPNATVTITGTIIYGALDRYNAPPSRERNTFWDYFGWHYSDPLLLTSISNIINLATIIFENQTLSPSLHGQINFDPTQLDAFNIAAEKERLEHFRHEIGVEISNLGYSYFRVEKSIAWKIEEFENEFSATLIILWLFSLPTLIPTLFLAIFSLGLLYGKKHLQIGILKTRGASSRQMFIILLGESIFTTLISIGFGVVLGLPFAFLALQNTEALTLISQLIPMTLSANVIQPVILFGILFAILLNLRSILRLSRIGIYESTVPKEKRKPFWKKYFLDIIMFVTGLLGFLSILILWNLITLPSSDPTVTGLYVLISFIATFLGIPSPILITLGGAMLIVRLLPILLQKSARWTWKVEGGLVAFSFRNVLNRISPAIRATLLLSIVLVFSMAFISIPYNVDVNVRDNIYYNYLGSDILITPRFPNLNQSISIQVLLLNQLILNYLETNFTGIASVSPIVQANHRSLSDSIIFLGVDINTFAQTAFFREDFLNPDVLSSLSRLDMLGAIRSLLQNDFLPDNLGLSVLLSRLRSNTTVLVQEDDLKARDLDIGDELPFLFRKYNETTEESINLRYDFEIVGKFKFWPLFITRPVSLSARGVHVIANFSTVLEYVNASLLTPTKFHYLVRVNPGVSMIQLKEQIVNKTGWLVSSFEEVIENYLNLPTRSVLLTTINSSLLMLLTVTLFTILMFGFNQLIERDKEIGVERALGMNLSQTSLLFILEAMILILFGVGVGIIVGMFIAQLLLSVVMIALNFLFPIGEALVIPTTIQYPWTQFLAITGVMIIIGLVSSLIPAYLATRLNISSRLRAE
ncbi:MAG: FtsX-like permease family protein [Candidatus Hermodarchaeota archaeon]